MLNGAVAIGADSPAGRCVCERNDSVKKLHQQDRAQRAGLAWILGFLTVQLSRA